MFQGLQKKWKVSGWRFFLVLLTFAVGGSLTGLVGKKIMNGLGVESTVLYIIIYILIITIIWPLMVLLISIPLGQFPFFKKYISRIGQRLAGKKQPHK
jgi:hypothetical protein